MPEAISPTPSSPQETKLMDFDDAFEAAVKEHSTEEKAQETEESNVEESESLDLSEEETQPPEETEEAPDQESESAEFEVSDEDFAQSKDNKQLFENLKNWRAKLTQRSQDISSKEKQLDEGLKGLGDLKQWLIRYQQNPKEVILELAKEQGLSLQGSQAAPAADTNGDGATEAVASELEQLLGSDITNALMPTIQKIADQVADQKMKPVLEFQKQSQQKALESEIDGALAELDTSRPDWKQHETRMLEISRAIKPAQGTSYLQYMENIYDLATLGVTKAEATKKTLDRMKKSEKSAESSDTGVSSTRVSPKVDKVDSFDEAFELAMKGIRVEE